MFLQRSEDRRWRQEVHGFSSGSHPQPLNLSVLLLSHGGQLVLVLSGQFFCFDLQRRAAALAGQLLDTHGEEFITHDALQQMAPAQHLLPHEEHSMFHLKIDVSEDKGGAFFF